VEPWSKLPDWRRAETWRHPLVTAVGGGLLAEAWGLGHGRPLRSALAGVPLGVLHALYRMWRGDEVREERQRDDAARVEAAGRRFVDSGERARPR
jgi:hypothetical protein